MVKPKPKIEYAIVCDDVRREDNGKMILIGIYGKDIRLQSYPAHIRLSLMLAFRSEETQTIPLGIRVLQGGETALEAKHELVFGEPGEILMHGLSGLPFVFTSDTDLNFEVKLGNARYKSVCRFPVLTES